MCAECAETFSYLSAANRLHSAHTGTIQCVFYVVNLKCAVRAWENVRAARGLWYLDKYTDKKEDRIFHIYQEIQRDQVQIHI
jgi:hypothetical protein